MKKRNSEFYLVQLPGWLLFIYLVYAQAISAFSYQAGVAMGTQEPASMISAVGVAFWYGFAFADLVFYIPLLALGLIGHWNSSRWGSTALAAALGITVYWPIICLAALVAARDAPGWYLEDETPYWIVLPLIALWGGWSLWRILRSHV